MKEQTTNSALTASQPISFIVYILMELDGLLEEFERGGGALISL